MYNANRKLRGSKAAKTKFWSFVVIYEHEDWLTDTKPPPKLDSIDAKCRTSSKFWNIPR